MNSSADHEIIRAESRRWFPAASMAAPGVIWLFAFLLVPLVLVFAISFFSTGEYGEIERPLTAEHYRRFAGFGSFGWSPLYPLTIWRSVLVAGASTALCVMLALPLAFFLASRRAPWKSIGLVLVTIPLWTNLLIRTYAWQMLLADDGLVARVWHALGGQAALYPGSLAVYIGLVCDYLPFLVLPIYASVEKIDWTLAEAARDLGAPPGAAFWHAVWPQIRPGVVAGTVLVFVPGTAQFVIPDLLGGAKSLLLGNIIQQQFGPSQNWPFGSAVASVAMLAVLLGMWVCARLGTRQAAGALSQ